MLLYFSFPSPLFALGAFKGMTRFNLSPGHAGPYLYIFANGGRRYSVYNASGKQHGMAVAIFSDGKMRLESWLDGTEQSSLEGMVDDGLGVNLFVM